MKLENTNKLPKFKENTDKCILCSKSNCQLRLLYSAKLSGMINGKGKTLSGKQTDTTYEN